MTEYNIRSKTQKFKKILIDIVLFKRQTLERLVERFKAKGKINMILIADYENRIDELIHQYDILYGSDSVVLMAKYIENRTNSLISQIEIEKDMKDLYLKEAKGEINSATKGTNTEIQRMIMSDYMASYRTYDEAQKALKDWQSLPWDKKADSIIEDAKNEYAQLLEEHNQPIFNILGTSI